MPGQKERSQRGRRENNAQRDRRPRDKRSGGRRERDGYDQHETPRREKGSRAKRDRMLIAGFDDDRRAPPNRNYQDMNMQQLKSRRENEYEQQVCETEIFACQCIYEMENRKKRWMQFIKGLLD